MDEDLRTLARLAASGDARAQAHLDRARQRAGQGWHGETRPPGVECARTKNVYSYRGVELVHVPHVAANAPFYIGRFHFMRRDWAALAPVAGLGLPRQTDFDGSAAAAGERLDYHPVVNVSKLDTERLLHAIGLRLPSRREWEVACFGGPEHGTPCEQCKGTGAIEERAEPLAFDIGGAVAREVSAPPMRRIACPGCSGRRVRHGPYPWGNVFTDEKTISRRHKRFGYWLHSTGPSAIDIRPDGLLPARANASWCGAYDLMGNAHHWVADGTAAYGGSYGSDDFSRNTKLDRSNGDAHPEIGFRPVLNLG